MIDLPSYISAIHAGRRRNVLTFIVTLLLWPFSLLFRAAIALRNLAYDTGLVRGRRLECKVISIGNLTTGGTGKTPVTMLIAENLGKTLRTAILSRGFRSGREHESIVLRGDQINAQAAPFVGDEILMLAARLPNVWFAIGADRYKGGSLLVTREQIQAAILDDGFQHRQVARDCDIVLVDATNPFGNGFRLPAGPLREEFSALQRCNIVLLTRCESVDRKAVDHLEKFIGRYIEPTQIFKLRISISEIRALAESINLPVTGRRVWLFSGIGNPVSFEKLVVGSGLEVVGHTIYSDHHNYNEKEYAALARILIDGRADCLLTTAKDAVKIPTSAFAERSCGVVEIGIDFVDRADIFWGIIARSVGA